MKKVVLIAFALCFALNSKAQQDVQLTHWMYDKISYNPAAVGFKDAWCVTAINRQQWTGFDGGGEPTTTLLNFATPKIGLIKGAVGLSIYNDQVGWETTNVFRLSYALHLSELGIKFGPGDLAIGLSAGYATKVINATWIPPTLITDVSIPNQNSKDAGLSFNAGLHYATDDWYVGASTTNLSQTELTTLNITGVRHYYIMGGYDFNLDPIVGLPVVLRPNVLLKTDATKTQYDFNINVLAFNTVWAGATVRPGDAIAPMAGLQRQFKNSTVQVGYSYGLGTSFLSNYFTNGNHEIMLNYCFKVVPPVKYEREVHPYLL